MIIHVSQTDIGFIIFTDKVSGSSKIYQSSKILDGFCLAQKKDKSYPKYTVPSIPQGYRPKAAVTGVSQLPKLYGKLDKTLRGLIIGEAMQGNSFQLLYINIVDNIH